MGEETVASGVREEDRVKDKEGVSEHRPSGAGVGNRGGGGKKDERELKTWRRRQHERGAEDKVETRQSHKPGRYGGAATSAGAVQEVSVARQGAPGPVPRPARTGNEPPNGGWADADRKNR